MGVFAIDKDQLTYIYTEESVLGNKLLSYAQSANKAIRSINISKEKLAATVWAELLELLDSDFKSILTLDHPDATKIQDTSEFTTDDWIKIINNNPSLLQHPIAINGTKAVVINERFDFYQFYEADGGNFDKSAEAIKTGNHNDTSENEAFNTLKE
ncbi:MAG: hypothetical protein HKN90_08885 [Flavobacteriaceae bacterium]|nr:hypothetical protein [Flavobacteriaceae bacterium]